MDIGGPLSLVRVFSFLVVGFFVMILGNMVWGVWEIVY